MSYIEFEIEPTERVTGHERQVIHIASLYWDGEIGKSEARRRMSALGMEKDEVTEMLRECTTVVQANPAPFGLTMDQFDRWIAAV